MPFGLIMRQQLFKGSCSRFWEGKKIIACLTLMMLLSFPKTWEEHLRHWREVLQSLRQRGLMAKPEKCVWAAEEMEYLGHV